MPLCGMSMSLGMCVLPEFSIANMPEVFTVLVFFFVLFFKWRSQGRRECGGQE